MDAFDRRLTDLGYPSGVAMRMPRQPLLERSERYRLLMIFAVGVWLAEDVNEHVEGSIGWPWVIAIIVSALLLLIWPRLVRRR